MRIVTEPITGLRWVATSRGSRWLAWLPLTVAMSMFWIGFFVGRLTFFW